jgi:hypothetical protein
MSQLTLSANGATNSCSFKTFFKLGKGMVVVLKNEDEICSQLPFQTSDGCYIQYVSLGSAEHLAAINERLKELTNIRRDPSQQNEMVQRYVEHDFIKSIKTFVPESEKSGLGGDYDSKTLHVGGAVLSNLILI